MDLWNIFSSLSLGLILQHDYFLDSLSGQNWLKKSSGSSHTHVWNQKNEDNKWYCKKWYKDSSVSRHRLWRRGYLQESKREKKDVFIKKQYLRPSKFVYSIFFTTPVKKCCMSCVLPQSSEVRFIHRFAHNIFLRRTHNFPF